jgi:3-deoxy-manno-octulosonate cytidylyltransferase (CMP-KDO synthetase)
VSQIIVAADDERIVAAVEQFAGQAVMTRSDHPNGTSRIAQVAAELDPQTASLIVNVQGDEPQIEPRVIDELVDALEADPQAQMATVASEFMADEDPANPAITKVVVDQRGRAMYFSKSLIPCDRDGTGKSQPLKHPGLYAYRRDFLLKYVTLGATPLEQIEQLEQLRALEHGYAIAVKKTICRHHGIDTPEQYEEFVRWYQAQARGT